MNDITSRKNKELIWQTLYDNRKFDGFKQEQFPQILKLFEGAIESIAINPNYIGFTLLDKNKYVVELFLKQLNEYSISGSVQSMQDNNPQKESYQQQEPYLQQEIKSNNIDRLNKAHEEQINEFNKFNIDKPPEIDFSDNTDTLDTTIFNKNLEVMVKEREQETPLVKILELLETINNNQLKILSKLNYDKEKDNETEETTT